MSENEQQFEFKSEAQQLLDLMIHSVYSHKEVFLRELISNASDALDRLRVESITDKALMAEGHELEIRIEPDEEARTLTISDTGVGMSRQEVVDNLGTIAKSGTKAFIEKMKAEDATAHTGELIGQFGVGFYSSFMVADNVTVVSRRAGEARATMWQSSGGGTYTVADAERDAPGTSVTLHLRPADPDDALQDLTQVWALRQIIKKYSDFVTHPIKVKTVRTVGEGEGEGEDEGEGDKKEIIEWPTINSMKAIWTRPSSEVSDDEYKEFYKHVSHDWSDPLDRISFKAEGTFEYSALLYVPGTPPMDLYWRESQWGLQLYVNRVLIKERAEDLLPSYLRFVKGVVDSPDLSLNVSREMLQQDRRLRQIKKRIIKKVIDALGTMSSERAEDYAKFWDGFGRVIKEGVISDADNRDELMKLVMFASSNDKEKLTSLDGYIERMKDGQDTLYYITGESRAAVEKSPHLESLFEKGYEVLFLIDPVDELVVEHVKTYQDKKLQSVGKGTVELGTEDERKKAEEERAETEKQHETLLVALKDALEDEVKEVRVSTRLTSSAACLVGEETDMTPQMERLLEQAGQTPPKQKRILEINSKHPLVDKMNGLHISDDREGLRQYARLMYGQALLAEGSPLPDPAAFNELVTEVMVRAAQ